MLPMSPGRTPDWVADDAVASELVWGGKFPLTAIFTGTSSILIHLYANVREQNPLIQ